jgi:signal transduction histidine kinase
VVTDVTDGSGGTGKDPGAVEARLRSLLRANSSIVGELSLSAVLRRIVDAARELLDVEYGALGVIAANRQGLDEFVHSGIDRALVTRIGHLPRGEGLLGTLIEDPRPIRLARLGDDVRSVGFPANHPPMSSFLGVPVRVRTEVFGNLYLCGTQPRDFTDEEVEVVTGLAATAGIAIENARLFDESRRRQTWLEETSELTRELLSTPRADALDLVAETVHRLADAERVALHTPSGDSLETLADLDTATSVTATVVGQGDSPLSADDERTLAGWVLATGAALRRDEDGDLEVVTTGPPQELPDVRLLNGPGLLVVALIGSGRQHGALVISRGRGQRGFAPGDVETATTFAGHVSLALEVAARRRDQERIQLLEDRARIARDLHDHVIQQLFAAGMTVQGVMASLGDRPEAAMLDGVVDLVDEAVGQIRTSIFHLRTQPRTAGGLRASVLETLRDVRDALGAKPQVRFVGPVDSLSDAELVADVRAVVREGLSNVARHAGARAVSVTVAAQDDSLSVVVTDDGAGLGEGLGEDSRRSGLANLDERAVRRGGELSLTTPAHGGTRLDWRVPLR